MPRRGGGCAEAFSYRHAIPLRGYSGTCPRPLNTADFAHLMPAYGGCHKELVDQLRAGDWDHQPPPAVDLNYVFKAIVGIASPQAGVITSLQEQIEWRLRISSLAVGLLVGLMSLVEMIRKLRRR
jgi:hypothetical protein